jgi:hypothetical protein
VLALALAAALLHLMPTLRALGQARAHPGYEFTGNLSTSPDYMQYRVWARRTLVTGPLVDNRFTAEPSPPHLPVLFYWAIGRVARASGARPELVNTAFGAALAFALVLLVHAACRRFLAPRPAAWALLLIVLGGGLGAWVKLAKGTAVEHPGLPLAPALAALDDGTVWEAYRSHYVVKTLFDPHFLAIWTATLAAVLALHSALRRPSLARALAAAAIAAAATWLHVYEGPLLIAIAACVAVAMKRKGARAREWLPACALVALASAASCAAQVAIYRRAGLPMPAWEPPEVPFANVALAYPIAWNALALGGARWWKAADRDGAFLAGWAAACALLTLSGPYNPYADRGPMTWSVPLYAIAAAIWFERSPRVTLARALAVLALAGATPALELRHRWFNAYFRANEPAKFMGPEQREIRDALLARAGADDVLLADYLEYRWLAPEFPGRAWHGHFFNTPDFPAKRERVERFLTAAGDDERARFLRESGARFLFVPAQREPAAFERLAGLTALARNGAGTLFEVERDGASRR